MTYKGSMRMMHDLWYFVRIQTASLLLYRWSISLGVCLKVAIDARQGSHDNAAAINTLVEGKCTSTMLKSMMLKH